MVRRKHTLAEPAHDPPTPGTVIHLQVAPNDDPLLSLEI